MARAKRNLAKNDFILTNVEIYWFWILGFLFFAIYVLLFITIARFRIIRIWIILWTFLAIAAL